MRWGSSGTARAVRSLARSPVFTAVSVLTLAVGIGASAAIFGVVNGVLLKPLPFEDPGGLVGVWHRAPGLGFEEVNMSPALYFTYRDEGRSFEDIGVWDDGQVAVTGTGEPEQVTSVRVTAGVFPLLGVRPVLGRAFTEEEDAPGGAEVVMLGWSYWQRRFGGDAGAIGRTLRVAGRERVIIGVTGRGFRFLDHDPAVYLPFRFDRSTVGVGNFSYQSLARLAPGVTLAQASAEVERLVPVAVERYGGITLNMLREARFGANLRPLKDDVVGDVGNVLWVLFGTVGLVLLIACANVANLFLVRSDGREREMAIRTALGASRWRLARQLLGESLVLGLAGGVAGLALAAAGLRLLMLLAPRNLPRLEEIGIDATVVAFTLVVSLSAGLVFGLFPVLRPRSGGLTTALKEGGRGASEGRERHRLRGAIATAEVALALVLLVAAGLMVRSFVALRDVEPGFEGAGEILTLRISIPSAEVSDAGEAALAYEHMLGRMAQIPGVRSAGATFSLPLEGRDSNDGIQVEDHPSPADQIPPIRRFKWVAGEYFETLRRPLLAGRALTWADIRARSRVVVVTENFAREYWGDAEGAVGRRIRDFGETPWREIVGVVGDVRDDGLAEPSPAIVYFPLAVDSFWGDPVHVPRSMAFALRVTGRSPRSVLPEVREAVRLVNPNLPLANVSTLDEIVRRSLARTSFTLVMLGIAAVVALLLGVIGIYGVIAYIVSQRTREIGVRLALGAERSTIVGLVVRQGAVFAAAGTAIGLLAAAGLTRLMAGLLFGVKAADPLTYGLAAIAGAGAALLASWLPAVRAAALDPGHALRSE